MIPAFDPGPNRFGRPPVFTAGVGPEMTAVAGEVADGFLVHPVNSRRSLLELTLPALERGAQRSGRALDDLEIVCVTIIVTGRDEEQFDAQPRSGSRATRVLRHDSRLHTGVRAPRLRRRSRPSCEHSRATTVGTRWPTSSPTT